jgi:hypothetical protein
MDFKGDEMKYNNEQMRQLMREFEGMVRALNTKFNEDEIFKLVAMILNNHIQDGVFTDEYVDLSKAALHMRRVDGQQLNPVQHAIAYGFETRPKKI